MFHKKSKMPNIKRPHKSLVVIEGLDEIEYKNQITIGQQVVHRTLGKGMVKSMDSEKVKIDFAEHESKDLIIDICLKNHLLFSETNT